MHEQSERERRLPPHWLPYFTVENSDDASEQADRLGGRGLPDV